MINTVTVQCADASVERLRGCVIVTLRCVPRGFFLNGIPCNRCGTSEREANGRCRMCHKKSSFARRIGMSVRDLPEDWFRCQVALEKAKKTIKLASTGRLTRLVV